MKIYTILLLLGLGSLAHAMDEESKKMREQETQRKALWFAVDDGNCARAEALLKAGAKPNALNSFWGGYGVVHWLSPLGRALEKDNAAMVRLLLDYKADPNGFCFMIASHRGTTIAEMHKPLHRIARGHTDSDIRCAQLLVKSGADVHGLSHVEQTPLHRACIFKQKDLVAYLLSQGAWTDVNKKNMGENTPAMWAAMPDGRPDRCNPTLIKYLLCSGASIDDEDCLSICDELRDPLMSLETTEDARKRACALCNEACELLLYGPKEDDYEETARDIIAAGPMAPHKRGNVFTQLQGRQYQYKPRLKTKM